MLYAFKMQYRIYHNIIIFRIYLSEHFILIVVLPRGYILSIIYGYVGVFIRVRDSYVLQQVTFSTIRINFIGSHIKFPRVLRVFTLTTKHDVNINMKKAFSIT